MRWASGRIPVRTKRRTWFAMRAQAYTTRCPPWHNAANRVTTSARSVSPETRFVRSLPPP